MTQNTVFRNMIPLKEVYPPLHVRSSISPNPQLIQFRIFKLDRIIFLYRFTFLSWIVKIFDLWYKIQILHLNLHYEPVYYAKFCCICLSNCQINCLKTIKMSFVLIRLLFTQQNIKIIKVWYFFGKRKQKLNQVIIKIKL